MSDFRVELTLAIGFLTRLRLPSVPYSDAAMARAVRWYPAIGLGIGIVLAVLFLGLAALVPKSVAALITICAGMLLTGALHEDGLADLADGLGGSPDKDRALEIMRDSRIGTYGVLALGMTLALKITALTSLPPVSAAVAIVAGHSFGRFAILWLMDRLPYARSDGAANFMSGDQRLDMKLAWSTILVTLVLVAMTVGFIAAIATVLATLALTSLLANKLRRRFGGYTGDALGASEQLVEALVPLVFLACL